MFGLQMWGQLRNRCRDGMGLGGMRLGDKGREELNRDVKVCRNDESGPRWVLVAVQLA